MAPAVAPTHRNSIPPHEEYHESDRRLPTPYAELEFSAYGPDAEQTVEFRLADDPFAPDAPECASRPLP